MLAVNTHKRTGVSAHFGTAPPCYNRAFPPRETLFHYCQQPTLWPASPSMKRGFYTIMSAQFFSSLADNAIFVV
ncbi:MAG: hypothetical protein EOO26_06420, partial [Comamonadaceae bacterium]